MVDTITHSITQAGQSDRTDTIETAPPVDGELGMVYRIVAKSDDFSASSNGLGATE
jgi:hypothetical protein